MAMSVITTPKVSFYPVAGTTTISRVTRQIGLSENISKVRCLRCDGPAACFPHCK